MARGGDSTLLAYGSSDLAAIAFFISAKVPMLGGFTVVSVMGICACGPTQAALLVMRGGSGIGSVSSCGIADGGGWPFPWAAVVGVTSVTGGWVLSRVAMVLTLATSEVRLLLVPGLLLFPAGGLGQVLRFRGSIFLKLPMNDVLEPAWPAAPVILAIAPSWTGRGLVSRDAQ